MDVTDWFRSPEATPAAMEDFERRLQRARRHNRPQYLRVKALALAETDDAEAHFVARQLFERALQEHPDDLLRPWVHEFLANLLARSGELGEAERHYREAHARSLTGNVKGYAHVGLAELIFASGQREKYENAIAVLDEAEESALNDMRYREAVARARLAAELGWNAQATRSARDALAAAGAKQPQFPRHPTVGRVVADVQTLTEMRALAERRD